MQERQCPVCDVRLGARPSCPNYWCHRRDRGFEAVWAVGDHGGDLRHAIASLKYRRDHRWAAPLGGLLARFMLDRAPCFEDIDLLLGAPGNTGRARSLDHTVEILRAAAPALGVLWPIDVAVGRPPILTKRAETRPMAGMRSAAARRLWAAGELRAALVVTDAGAVRNRRVLVFDDVFTDGSTLREVALALRRSGARAVSGLVLARQPLLDDDAVRQALRVAR